MGHIPKLKDTGVYICVKQTKYNGEFKIKIKGFGVFDEEKREEILNALEKFLDQWK